MFKQLQHFQAEDIKQDYDTGKDGTVVVMFDVEYEKNWKSWKCSEFSL